MPNCKASVIQRITLFSLMGLVLLVAALQPAALSAQEYDPSFYELSPDGKILLSWKGDLEVVNLAADPVLSRIDSIADFAFAARDSIGVVIPDYWIRELIFPPRLRSVGYIAVWARNLTHLQLNEGLEIINPSAIVEAPLKEIYMPASLAEVEGAFYSCREFERIEVSEESPYYAVEREMLIDLRRRALVLYPSGLLYDRPQLPEDLSEIAMGAFANSGYIQRIVVPEGVKNIFEQAFSDCHSLTTIDLPSTLREIAANAFGISPIDTVVLRATFPPKIVGKRMYRGSLNPQVMAVPDEALTLYANHPFWGRLAETLLPLSEMPALYQSVLAVPEGDALPYTIVDRDLYLELPEGVDEARLFDKDGHLKAIYVKSGSYSLQPGFYLLQIERRSYKLVIPNHPIS